MSRRSPPSPPEPGLAGLVAALHWHLRRRIASPRPGRHPGRQAGPEGPLRDLVPLIRHPDPRRIDIIRSILAPDGMAQVRRFAWPAPVVVHVVVDLSASVGARGHSDRHRIAALLAGALAAAGASGGDGWALWLARGESATVLHPPSRRRADAAELAEDISACPPQGRGCDGLVALAGAIPRTRTLTLLISDFEIAPPQLDLVLSSFAGHALIPVWLRDSGLEQPPPLPRNLPRLWRRRDPETGRAQTALLTPASARAAAEAARAARAALRATFARHGHQPVELRDQIDTLSFAADLAGTR